MEKSFLENTILGFTEAQIAEFGTTYGIAGLMLLLNLLRRRLSQRNLPAPSRTPVPILFGASSNLATSS